MSEYCFNRQFENETKVRIETNDRDLFIGIEKVLNQFLNNFKNGNEELDLFENEEDSFCRNEEYEPFKNENISLKFDGNENENQFNNISENEPVKSTKSKNKPPRIETPWGSANVGGHGYYAITSSVEGNCGKLVHRLVYEETHKCTLFRQAIIHHIDGNKLNNSPENLELLSLAEHNSKHKTGIKQNKKNTLTWEEYLETFTKKNTSGYLRVYKQKNPKTSQGFTYKYQYYDDEGNRKAIERVNLEDLEKEVKARGLPWQKL